MVDAIATNRMKPVIDRTFPFDQVKQAFSYMASGAHFGKVAISISSLLKNLEIGSLFVFLPWDLGRSGCCERTLTYAASSLGMRIRL